MRTSLFTYKCCVLKACILLSLLSVPTLIIFPLFPAIPLMMPNNDVNVHLLKTLQCRINAEPELFISCCPTYMDGYIYCTCAGTVSDSDYTKLLVLNVVTGAQCILNMFLPGGKPVDFELTFFFPVPHAFLFGLQCGYVSFDDGCFAATLDFQQRECRILYKIHCPVNLDGADSMRYTPWLLLHRKTGTFYRITMNLERLEWTPVSRIQKHDSRDYVSQMTSEYLLRTRLPGKHQIQCVKNGRVADLPNHITKLNTIDIAMVQRDKHLHLLFKGKTNILELIEMDEQMVFSESKLLVKLPQNGCDFYFYGIHDGSLVLGSGGFFREEVYQYQIALIKPQKLSILAQAKANEKAESQHFARSGHGNVHNVKVTWNY